MWRFHPCVTWVNSCVISNGSIETCGRAGAPPKRETNAKFTLIVQVWTGNRANRRTPGCQSSPAAATRILNSVLRALAELDHIKDMVKKHWLFVLGRPNGQRANLTAEELTNLDFGGLNLQSIVAPTANFTKSSFAGTDLSFADLFGANLESADCTGAVFHKADLRGARLHGAKLASANLEGADLRAGSYNPFAREGAGRTDLSGATMNSAVFKNASLDRVFMVGSTCLRADFQGASMAEADLSDVDLSGANLSHAKLKGAVLAGADLGGANFKGTSLTGADLRGALLERADFSEADVRDVAFDAPKRPPRGDLSKKIVRHKMWVDSQGSHGERAVLANADLSHRDLAGADLSAADLSGALLNSARLTGCKLTMCNLSRTDLTRANLMNADMRDINLTGAAMSRANLRKADLGTVSGRDSKGRETGKTWRADLSDADLSRANLSDASLFGAKLERANMVQTNLMRADMRGAVIDQANMRGAIVLGALTGQMPDRKTASKSR